MPSVTKSNLCDDCVQMLFDQIVPFNVVSEFMATVPFARLIHAEGRLFPPKLNVELLTDVRHVAPIFPDEEVIINHSGTLLHCLDV